MRMHLAGNHHGYAVARDWQSRLAAEGHEVVWHGPPVLDEGDDYAPPAIAVAQAVVADEDAGVATRGMVFGGDAAGETIAANKVNGARAVPGFGPAAVESARRHADTNVLLVPVDFLAGDQLAATVAAFVATEFSGDLDDARRLVNTAEFETSGTIEGWLVHG